MLKRICLLVFMLGSAAAVATESEVNQLLRSLADIEASPHRLQQSIEAGAERATLCVHCHGQDGNSKRDYIPNLASQNAEYLFTQFEMFANGKRKDYVMSKLAQGLTAEDKIAVALYFSRQPVQPRATQVSSTAKGQVIYQQVCFACHGSQGYGSSQYPRIAGQPYEFLEKTLTRFKNNDIERKDSVMASIIKNISEQELQEVAAYISNMQ